MNKKIKMLVAMMLVIAMSVINFAPFSMVEAGITDTPGTTRSRTTVEPQYSEYNMYQNLDFTFDNEYYIDTDMSIPFIKVFGLDSEEFVSPTYYNYDSEKFVPCSQDDAILKIEKLDDTHFKVTEVNADKHVKTSMNNIFQGRVDELYDSHTYFTGYVMEDEIDEETGETITVAYYCYRREEYYYRYQLMLGIVYGNLDCIKGDLDQNNVVDANDASVALELYKSQNATAEDISIGDMDDNQLIDANDASLILEYYKTHQ